MITVLKLYTIIALDIITQEEGGSFWKKSQALPPSYNFTAPTWFVSCSIALLLTPVWGGDFLLEPGAPYDRQDDNA